MPSGSKIQIVDANDNLVGLRARDEVDPITDIYRSSCVWIENSEGRVLLAQRKWTKDKDPGLWGTAAAGTVDEGETYESNAYKELEEEIGLTGVQLVPVAKIWEGEPRKHFIQVFRGRADQSLQDLKLQEKEVGKITWLTKAELLKDYNLDPGKYVPSMSQLLELLIPGSS